MKIHQVPMGARFEYEGEEYVKSGPMFATGKGGQRLIPKYAVLTPLGEVDAVPRAQRHEPISRAEVAKAFEAFYAQCVASVPEDKHAQLSAARDGFLKALDL